MTWYEFDTEAEAVAAEGRIVANVAAWVAVHDPDRYDPAGPALRGVRASNQQVVVSGGQTTRWAVPQQTASGTWVFPVPTAEDTAPMPVEVAIEGVGGTIVTDPQWPVVESEF